MKFAELNKTERPGLSGAAQSGSQITPECARRVGVEIEFGGLTALQAAEFIRADLGGSIEKKDSHRYRLTGTELGDLTVELDSKYVHSEDDASDLERKVRSLAGDMTGSIVPTELVTDPLPVSRIADIDALLDRLVAAGALGTQHLHLACGLHLNVEWTGREVLPILRILQAYLISAPDLRREIAPDRVRTLLPFIGRFPQDYEARILDPDYQPDFARFAADYCRANPSKNRELDLLPLLASIDEGAVADALGHPPEAVRPAFHYRLPNASLGARNWSIEKEWDRWLSVEALAADEDRLAAALSARQERQRAPESGGTLTQILNRVIGK
ncbi:amidoligase family protein [Roseibium marinum]|uniref:Putative amidoligase enzyme n=1 Tax=Roseibium marinum TaxID=281252 RepID=A0A2S3V1R2_9HYPH|nr:amidoligase family protein [Roseibium marinum]POF33810.1 putative amidoligase enzyme [Roseibium marinum]